MTTGDLRSLSRSQLVERAEQVGVARAAALTKTELIEAIRGVEDPSSKRTRTWFGRARDLVARVVEQGLHLPNTAKVLRGQGASSSKAHPPLPTVTLAEIYAAQGYHDKALAVVEAVLERAPDHAEARALRDKWLGSRSEDEPEPAEGAVEEPAASPIVAPAAGVPEGGEADQGPPPPRYDDVVALATDPRTAYVYWEVRAVSFARARWRAPEGQLVLRVLSMVPMDGGGVDRRSRDVPIDELVGDTFVTGLVPGSELRVAVGWLADDDFVAFAVAPELTMPRDYSAPVKSARRATMSEAAEMRAVVRAGSPPTFAGMPEHGPILDVADQRLQSYASGAPTSVVHFQYSTERVRTVLRAGGASDMLVDRETEVVNHYGLGLGPGAGAPWLRGGASDLLAGGASDLVAGGASDLHRASG